MNYSLIFYILGRIIFAVGLLMLLPLGAALLFGDSLLPFVIPLLLALALGIPLSFIKPKNRRLLAREGFVSVGLSWIVMSLIGCLPYIINGAIPVFVDAFFETVSGFSTTGATVLADVEAVDKSLLLWRSLTQWIGGMGVLVFLLAIMSRAESGTGSLMQLMRAEVPGPTVGKLVARISTTARVLYGIYIVLTLAEFIFLIFGDMNTFEALCHSLSTASTGGFGVKNDSLMSYSAYSQYVVAVFMLLFGTNLNLFYLLLTGHLLRALKNEELRWYLGIAAAVTALISVGIFASVGTAEGSFRHGFFQTVSIMTTSGFATSDFELWPFYTQLLLVFLMFCGGCAGSTAGGFKISRLLLLLKNGRREVKYISHPRAVLSVKLEGKTVDHETVRGTTSYIIMFTGLFVLSSLALIILENCDLVTGVSAAATTLNNVGPALGELGPTDTFTHLCAPSKLILCFNMLAGRLELFPMLILLSPSTWRN